MERTKYLVALAPFIALALASTFLQGYWGTFGVFPFPYLSFQELLTYSAAPFFGFILFFLIGWAARSLDDKPHSHHQRSHWPQALIGILLIIFCGALLYFDQPEKWLYTPMVAIGLVSFAIRNTSPLRAAQANNPTIILAAWLMIFASAGAYGYGRMSAERIVQLAEPNAMLTIESRTDPVQLIGKLGTYYFFLDKTKRLNVVPEQSVKRIKYQKIL